MTKFVIVLIRFYQLFISPLFAPSCRFYPTCSQYAVESLKEFGVLKGSYLSLRRLLKCHPGNSGGYDPITPPCSNNCQHNYHDSNKQKSI